MSSDLEGLANREGGALVRTNPPACRRCGRPHGSCTPGGAVVLVDLESRRCNLCTCGHGMDCVGCPLCARNRMWREHGMLGPEEEDP